MALHLWEGTFTSKDYKIFVNGDARIFLPMNFDITKNVIGQLMLRYNGLYRKNDNQSVTVYKRANEKILKGINEKQELIFTMSNITDDYICGQYVTINPNDSGTFTMSKIEEEDDYIIL